MTRSIEDDYSRFQDETSWYKHAGQRNAGELGYLTLGLTGETGEFADAVKKIVREAGFEDPNHFWQVLNREGVEEKLIDELGDVLWYMNKLMRFIGISMDELMVRNTYKLYSRMLTRAHANLTELQWPFTDEGASFEEVQLRYDLLPDKEHDNV